MDLSARYFEAQHEYYLADFIKEQLKVLDDIWSGAPYIGATFYVPSELLALFNVRVLYLERIAGFAAAIKLINNLNLYRSKFNLPEICTCTYQLLFHTLVNEKIIPRPAAFVATSYTCEDAWQYCKYAAAEFNVPFHFISVPKEKNSASIKSISSQLNHLYHSLANQYDIIGELSEIINVSNETIRIKQNIDSLRIEYPGIFHSNNSLKLFTLYNDLGRKSALNIFSKIYQKIRDGVTEYKPLTTIKLIWLGVIPLYLNHIIRDIENQYGCRVVFEELFYYSKNEISEDTFYQDLAVRICDSIHFLDEMRTEILFDLIDKFHADGVIHFTQRDCQFLGPKVPNLRQKFEQKKIPFLEISGDVVDSQFFDVNHCWNQLDAFFEIINHRKNADKN